MDTIERLLKSLTEAHGVPGYETEVRRLIRDSFERLGEVTQDKIGSLICRKAGESDEPRVMLVAHMDEIGFMVKHITAEGFVKFTSLGGWWSQAMPAQRVIVKTGRGDVIGVIGAKPPHLLSKEDRAKVMSEKEMYVDVGATSRSEIEALGVQVGDPIVPLSQFTILAPARTYLAKAFDDRVGCALVIAVLRNLVGGRHPNTVLGVATAQEEVGVRGATTSVSLVDPHVAIILEVDLAGDVPDVKAEECSTKLGAGPTVLVYDAHMIPNLKLRDLLIRTARELGISLQLSALEGGATDGSAIQVYRGGVPTIVLGVPTRHVHSHSAIIKREDFDRARQLVTKVVRKLDARTVADLTA